MSALKTLARMLGVAPRLAEDALHSERAAQAVLSRRNLFAAAGAMAAGAVFCPSAELIAPVVNPWALAQQMTLVYEFSAHHCEAHGVWVAQTFRAEP